MLDTRAFHQLVSDYSGPALGVAQRILSDNVLAEDAVQETFLKIVRCRQQYDPSRPFSLWFYTILRNVCRDMLRQRTRHIKAISEITAGSIHAIQKPTYSLEVKDVLQSLPASEQAVLTLRIIHDLSFPDIAVVVGISVAAAKKRAQRGLRALRQRMHAADLADRDAEVRPPNDYSAEHSKSMSPNTQPKRI